MILLFLKYFKFYVGVSLIYNAVLVSGVQQSDLVIIYIYLLFFRFFSHKSY